MDATLTWSVQWYLLCEDPTVNLEHVIPGHVVVRPCEFNDIGAQIWWTQRKAKRVARDEASVDTDIKRAEAEALAFAAIVEAPDDDTDGDLKTDAEGDESQESSNGDDEDDASHLTIILLLFK